MRLLHSYFRSKQLQTSQKHFIQPFQAGIKDLVHLAPLIIHSICSSYSTNIEGATLLRQAPLWHKCGSANQRDRAYGILSKCKSNMLILKNVHIWTPLLTHNPSESSWSSRCFSMQLFKVLECLNVHLSLHQSFHNHHGHKREGMLEMATEPLLTIWK